MRTLTTGVSSLVLIFLGCLLTLVLMRLLTGRINTQYLLYGRKTDGTPYLSPERIQLMVFTLWTALSYLLNVFESRVINPTPETVHSLPEVPTITLALLGGSHAIYLGGKVYSMLVAKIAKGV